ncbi:hypothetical protein KQI84_04150 [bacterium]|nr:hypothetical protein [bacterium]
MRRQVVLLFPVFLAIALLLNAPHLGGFLITDDLPMLYRTSPLSGAGFWDCWKVWGNGFWRPLNCVMFFVLQRIAGFNALPFDVLAVVIHAIVATLTVVVGTRVLRLAMAPAVLAGVLMVVHVGAFHPLSQLNAACDSTFAAGLLLFVLGCHALRESPTRLAIAQWVGGLTICALSKELVVLLPVYFLLWTGTWRWKALSPRQRMAGAVTLAVSGAYFIALLLGQFLAENSYSGEQRVLLNPVSFGRQVADYLFSVGVPYIHVVEAPFGAISLSHNTLWGIRGLIAIGVLVFAWKSWQGAIPRQQTILAVSLVLPLLPPSLLADPPQSRYLYSALPFFCLLLADVVHRARRRSPLLGRWAFGGVCVLGVVYAMGFYASPTVDATRQTERAVEAFIHDAKGYSKDWIDGTMISIYAHPHPGQGESRWVYSQLLFELFIPEKDVTVVLDHIVPETSAAYAFDSNVLRLRPIPPGSHL